MGYIGYAIASKVFEQANKLNKKLPKSEKWFWKLWKKTDLYNKFDMPNEVFIGFIPDVINHKFKYIIEVNGKIHDKPSVARDDVIKKRLFKNQGYSVFTVKAHNQESFDALCFNVKHLTLKIESKTKTIIRRPVQLSEQLDRIFEL